MTIVLILLLAFGALYASGLLSVSAKRAAVFVGSLKNGGSMTFTRCTGSIHRVIRFRESRSYSFHLDTRLRRGEVTVQVTDLHRVPLMTLTPAAPTAQLPAGKGRAYLLFVRFRDADGDLNLDWV